MPDSKTIRWKQRFNNFSKAFHQLEKGINQFEKLDDLAKEGLVQRFEYTFELSWKTLKDYLESEGLTVKFPREVIKTAYQNDLIDNGDIWMEMLEQRNLMTHTYDEEIFNKVLDKIINEYYIEVNKLFNKLNTKL